MLFLVIRQEIQPALYSPVMDTAMPHLVKLLFLQIPAEIIIPLLEWSHFVAILAAAIILPLDRMHLMQTVQAVQILLQECMHFFPTRRDTPIPPTVIRRFIQ